MNSGEAVVREKFGPSRIVPYIRGELPADRHRRRHSAAVAQLNSVRAWCEHRGIALVVSGSNHPETDTPLGWKWDFRVTGKFAQWRPFAGKLSLKTDLRNGPLYCFKVHDHEQLFDALEWWLAAGVRP